ncbi:MAG: hypothetical protein RLY35_1668 [Bacteroidota bacterium]|jgi:hypothetical protein
MTRALTWVKNNFYLFGTTAFPGIHKIVLLFVVNTVYSLNATADFISDIFILYLLGYLTVFNWANFILSDMLKLAESQQRTFFGKIFTLSLMVNISLILLVYVFFSWHWLTDFFGFSFLLIAWSYQQLWRHYMIAKVRYRQLFYADFVMLLLTVISILFSNSVGLNLYFVMSVPALVVPMLFDFLPFCFPNLKWNSRIFSRVINYTLINLSTGGVQLIFAPLSHQLLSAEFTRMIGFTNNLGSMALLLPRALAYQYLPALSSNIRMGLLHFQSVYVEFSRKINLLVFAMLILGIVFVPVLFFMIGESSIMVVLIGLVVYVNLLLGQLSVPASNVLVVQSQSGRLLRINIISFFVIIGQICCLLLLDIESSSKMLAMLAFSILVGLMRYIYLVMYLKRTL